MRVLHLLCSSQFSGAENVVSQIIGVFKGDADIEMVYCSRDGQIREALAERRIPFVPISELSVGEVKRVIHEQKPDIIHAHDMRASFVAACACGKIPLVSHVHNNNFDSRGLSVKSIAYAFAAMKAKHIFWVSQSSFDGYAFHSWFKNKSTVLYNIIDINALYQKMEKDSRSYDYDVIYVGRLSYPKDPQRLMRVFGKIREMRPGTKMVVVGTGELEAETKNLCKELGLEKHVEFLGFQSNPLKMLHDSKVMLMTSRWEGLPMCALEAMALGVPIVSTPTDGLTELFEDGKGGYLSNDDQGLVDGIISIICDEAVRKNLSDCAAEKAIIINDMNSYRESILTAYK